MLEFKDLPELKKGEKYVLYYATKAAAEDLKAMYGTGKPNIMYNTATAETDTVQKVSSDEKYITYNKTIIEKKGKPNADGLIDWEITINAPLKTSTGFLKDYTLTDVLPKNVQLMGVINVKCDGETTTNKTITQEELENGVKLSDLDPTAYCFTITYQTTVPTDGAASVTNVASLDNKLSAEKTVPISQGVWNLTKTHNRTENDIAYWNLNAVNVTGASQFELTDTIGDTTDDSGAVLRDKHYALASELQNAIEKGLTLTLTNNRTLNYAEAEKYLTITYLDAYNNEVGAKDSATHVLSFTVAVKQAENGGSITVRQMVLKDVPTYEERSDKLEGADWTFTNNAKIMQGGNAKANDSAKDVYLTSVFEKKVSIGGRNNYLTEDSKVNYDDIKDQTLMYSIKLVTTGTETGKIVIEDALPEGVVFDTTNAANKFKLYVDNVQRAWVGGNWTIKFQTRYLKIEVGGCDDGKQHVIEFQYEVKLDMTNDSRWKDLLTSDVPYKNSASYGDGSHSIIKKDSITLTVHKDLPSLIKTGEQIWDSVNNKWGNKVTYKVIINPTGKQLGNGKTLELLDKMQVSNGANFYGENVKLYYYDKDTAVENLQKVEPGLYSASINDPTKEGWLYMTIPDKKALLLTYDCVIDPGSAVSPTLSNTVSLNGKISGSSDGLQFETNKSSAQITRGQLIIYKVDAGMTTQLEGAKFTLSRYVPNQGFTEGLTGETNENGELIFGITKNDPKTLSPNVLYRLTETKAPTNYILDSTPKYLFFYEKDADPKEAFKTALGVESITDNGQTVTADKVIFGCSTNTTQLTVKNTYNRLTVQKYWHSAADDRPLVDADIPEGPIQVQLYRYTEDQKATNAEPVGEAQNLNRDNGWSYTWAGENEIPATDRNGRKCYYLVKEVTTGNWVTEITNNDGIQTGKIFITNKVYSSYELPSTGGMGTMPFAAVGGMLTVGAALLLAKRKKHEEKGE